MKTKNIIFLIALIILLTACSNMNEKLSYLDKSFKKPINNISVVSYESEKLVMKVRNSGNSASKYLKDTCKKNKDKVTSLIFEKIGIMGELTARDIKRVNFGEKADYILIIEPISYFSENRNSCEPTELKFQITLIESEKLTNNWDKKEKNKIFKEFTDNINNNIIWRETFIWDFKRNPISYSKDLNYKIYETISKSLDHSGLFPSKTMSIDNAIIKNQEKYKANEERNKKTKDIQYKSESIRKLSSINCKIKDRLAAGYSGKIKAMCLGQLSFIDVKASYPSQKISMLNATEVHNIFTLNNSICPTISISIAEGSKHDKEVSFKKTYKEQILKSFNNKCNIDSIDGINFLTCGEKDKSYFLELSFSNENRIYKKNMLQVEKMCFDKLKKHYNNDELDATWRTKHGYNSNGFDANGYNIITDSKYDQSGFDSNNWNKDGINRLTKTKYDINGFDINNLKKDGTDKDGWNQNLKKFVGKKVEDKYYTLNIINFDSQMTNKLYNRSYYNELSYIKEKDGFKLVGKKIYGNPQKPKKIELYYFRSAKDKLLNLDKPNTPIMKSAIVLERIVTKKFDKNGYDEKGYDKDGWNPKLKIFEKKVD